MRQANLKPGTDVFGTAGIEGFSSQAERTPKGQMFSDAESALANDPFQLVLAIPRDKLPHIYLDCGTEDGFKFNDEASYLHEILAGRGVTHGGRAQSSR